SDGGNDHQRGAGGAGDSNDDCERQPDRIFAARGGFHVGLAAGGGSQREVFGELDGAGCDDGADPDPDELGGVAGGFYFGGGGAGVAAGRAGAGDHQRADGDDCG